jgi:hypothetical protein
MNYPCIRPLNFVYDFARSIAKGVLLGMQYGWTDAFRTLVGAPFLK